ncbi:MAG: hypothetical protein GXP19_09305 [Gammaproteobacteria bacterium]|nr:hypothetical protein [Gammaproteobacteria bacterium]
MLVNTSGTSVFETLKNSFQCPSSSFFIYACVLYIVLLAIPYVPGLELGLLLMIYYGKPGIVAAYICTFIGLNIAFAAGRLTSKYWTARPKRKLNLENQQKPETQNTIQAPSSWHSIIIQNRFFTPRSKYFLERHIHQHKYLSIAILLNLPGNWIVGGGGGISLLSGCHGSNSWPKFALTVALATSLLPALIFLGLISIETLLKTFGITVN